MWLVPFYGSISEQEKGSRHRRTPAMQNSRFATKRMSFRPVPPVDRPATQTAGLDSRRVWLAAFIYGLLIYACLPAGVAAIDDDFGYLRSVISTLQHGRPWTDDWLEPWAASFSALSALLYQITGNFYAATYGLLPVLAACSFGLFALLLRARGLGLGMAIWVSAIGLTFPTIFWKTIQYTGMALYIPCLLGAVWACEQRRWGLFFVAWGLALATRQSAGAWIILPLAVVIQTGWREGWRSFSRPWWAPLLAATGGSVLLLMLKVMMNKTHAQTVLTDRIFEQASWPAAIQTGLVGLGLFLLMAGFGRLILLLGRFDPAGGPSPRSRAALCGLALAAGALCFWDFRALLAWEHQAMSGLTGSLYLKLMVLLGAAGWVFRGNIIRPEFAAAAAGSLVLASLRGAVWDYYFVDLAIFALFGIGGHSGIATGASVPGRWWRYAATSTLVAATVLNGLLVLDFKAAMDRGYALCLLSEKALREGRLLPAELSFAPFGFAAWHLYPHYIRSEGRASSHIAGFDCYELPGAVEVGQGYSRSLHLLSQFRHEPPADRHNLIAEGRTRFLWFFRGEFYLLRFKTEADAPPMVKLPADYRFERFPLDEAEWRQVISGTR